MILKFSDRVVHTDKYNFNPNESYPLHCTTVWPGEPSRKWRGRTFMEWLRFNAPQNPAIHHTPSHYSKYGGGLD